MIVLLGRMPHHSPAIKLVMVIWRSHPATYIDSLARGKSQCEPARLNDISRSGGEGMAHFLPSLPSEALVKEGQVH
jgi:hypothetical protein